MPAVQCRLILATGAGLAVVAALGLTVGLGAPGWTAGLLTAVLANLAVDRGLRREARLRLGPADRVTLTRLTLVCGVTALAADAVAGSTPHPRVLAGLATVALVLDAVDGWLARRTGTVSAFGARFDMEVDALLILVLSADVARTAGAWVLAIGLARYLLYAASRIWPWLRAPLPPRYWAKVVAAFQGIALTVAASGLLPTAVTFAILLLALALLAESFGSQLAALRRQHRGGPSVQPAGPVGAFATALAALLVWFALVAPDRADLVTPLRFARLPVEGLVILVLVAVLPRRAGRWVAALAGLLLGVLAVAKLLDMALFFALDRPFNPAVDGGYLGSAVGLLGDSIGHARAVEVLVLAAVLCLGIVALMPFALVRVTSRLTRRRQPALRILTVLGAAWVLLAVFGVQVTAGVPVAAGTAARQAVDEVRLVRTSAVQEQAFHDGLGTDPLAATPAGDLLTGLRGKDVLVVFVESYGRVAVQDSAFDAGVDATLDAGTAGLAAAGFSARSAFLTSPTFGGISWLAHSTLESGLWVDSQTKYDALVAGQHSTLASSFRRAGWRTVSVIPSDRGGVWAAGSHFYRYEALYDRHNLGYRGPRFGYAQMPDQYTLAAFQRLELDHPHRPVMAEIDLVSSHTPWAPLPHLVAASTIGDGSVFRGMPAQGRSADRVWRRRADVQAAYGASVQYSMNSLVSFVQASNDPNLVLVVLGDHEPATIVSGMGASHDVPVSVIAHDPAVLARISGWGWQAGLRPRPDAPVWRMDAFRDRFLRAYGPAPS